MTNQEEISRRRTFAIISHPDAGKTTLTEKFLLYGGAIQSAGSVKGKIYGPLKTAEGTVFLQVLDLTKPQERSFKESLPEIRKKLEAEQRTAAKKNYTQRLRKNAIIRYFF